MKISKLLIACLIATAGTAAFAAKFNLKLGHAVNATDGQHAAAMINGARGGTIDIVSSGASNFNGIVANTAAL